MKRNGLIITIIIKLAAYAYCVIRSLFERFSIRLSI